MSEPTELVGRRADVARNHRINSLDLRPKLGRRPHRGGADRFLLVCFFDPTGVATVYENIALWQKFSRYGIEILNLWPTRSDVLAIPRNIDLDEYTGVIVHCTTSYHPDNLYSLDKAIERPFAQYDGVKILMKQDEHWRTARFATYIGEKKFDLVITCVSPEEQSKVYPPGVVGHAEFIQAFTGYVSPFMRSLNFGRIADRPFDITYRGSIQPLSFGRLGFEKRKIGYDVARAGTEYPLKMDISSRREERIGGTAWFDFLGRSRTVLGVESGANLFDFTGEVESWCLEFENGRPDCDHLSEEFYKEAHRAYLHRFEGNVNYAQISPRHLEAAAARSVQVLYEGHYSGIFIPHRHFLPLRRDLGNFDEVLDFIADEKRMSEMADRTFEEIVLNRQLHYESFVERVDDAIDRALARKGRIVAASRMAVKGSRNRRALVLAGHEPTMDPRVDWMAEGLTADFEVCELGACDDDSDRAAPSYERLSERRTRVRVGRQDHDCDVVPDILQMATESSVARQHLMLLYVLGELPAKALERSIGALDATEEDLFRFRWATRHFLNTNCALLQAGRLIGEFDTVVAVDLNTLPAGLALAEEYGATVLYDAHEFWPYAFMECRHWEVEFWSGFERNLAPRADLRVTVSPHLADVMSKEYGCEFLSVPNCAPKGSIGATDIDAALDQLAARDEVRFIFLGGFITGRGIEDLITAWGGVDQRAHLLLQGPDGPFKTEMMELARSYGLLGASISFPPAVDTADLVSASRHADVGIIPYAASSLNNRYCSPNKLSQYMAAGLPIICNNGLEFVKSVVVGNKLGIAVDFHNHGELARVVNELVATKNDIVEMSRRSRQFFEDNFNWTAVSGSMYAKLRDADRARPVSAPPDPDFSWIAEGREMRRKSTGGLDGAVPLFASAEIQRLTKEVDYLRSEFASETGRLIKEVEFLRAEFASETARLTREIGRYGRASITQLFLLCIRAPFIVLIKSPRTRARLIMVVKSLPMPIQLLLRSIRTGFRSRVRHPQSQ